MTDQEIFDTVLTHLRNQGVAAIRSSLQTPEHSICAYRSPEGHKCAVGCLIPDDQYTPDLEGKMIEYFFNMPTPPDWLLPFSEHDGLLHELQMAHDEHLPRAHETDANHRRSMARFEARMECIALGYGLTFTFTSTTP